MRKCIRTKLELLVCGVLSKTSIFASNSITNELIADINALTTHQTSEYQELIIPLQEIGRPELSDAVNLLEKR